MTTPTPPVTMIPAHEETVSCRGNASSAHPVTFLKIPETGRVQCPYCSHVFQRVE